MRSPAHATVAVGAAAAATGDQNVQRTEERPVLREIHFLALARERTPDRAQLSAQARVRAERLLTFSHFVSQHEIGKCKKTRFFLGDVVEGEIKTWRPFENL
jgi:hypothetical protein